MIQTEDRLFALWFAQFLGIAVEGARGKSGRNHCGDQRLFHYRTWG
jgi:hypothetical protein